MKKKNKIIIIIVVSIIIFLIISLLILNYLIENKYIFSWGRYDESNLELEVIWDDSDDIHFCGCYSESDDCPWGFEHNGLDFFFNNSKKVLAMAPGLVEEIKFRESDDIDNINIYTVRVNIRFNREIVLQYNFEPWTNVEEEGEEQLDELEIKEGDWVKTGDIIGEFVAYESAAHVDFSLEKNEKDICPKKYFTHDAYDEMMDLIHKYHPGWKMCYD